MYYQMMGSVGSEKLDVKRNDNSTNKRAARRRNKYVTAKNTCKLNILARFYIPPLVRTQRSYVGFCETFLHTTAKKPKSEVKSK